ncbi:MAG: DUF1640 domain-containing protein [Gammaproteobacteria bacterium]|nr:DUF1640 domain-containing protein [Gammaproteobacteria bacterium]
MSAMVKEVYDAFRSAGVSDELATAAALAVPPRDELATKTDFAKFRTEVKSDFAEFRTEVKSDIAELRTEFAELRTEFAELRSEVKTDIAELRTEFAELRTEVKTDIGEFRTEFAELRTEVKTDIGELRADTRCDMKDLEMRLTHRFYAAIGLAVAAIKALDFLLG